jgi:2'-5' RNA ligase
MIKLVDLLQEATGRKFEYGCVMLYFTFHEINKIHDAIDPNHIYTEEEDRSYGLEDEPHTTLLFGLHPEVTTEDVKKVLDNYTYSTCKVHNASLFENPKYDVLKFDVKGDNLHETNKDLKQYPFTSDFPNYHPHLTIGYLKPGTGKKIC